MFLKKAANKYKHNHSILCITLLLSIAFFACNEKREERKIERSFYYWKSVFKISDFEKQQLDSLKVKTLYIKFFDVDWDEAASQPLPKAVIKFADSSFKKYNIIPTIFITNECIQKIDSAQVQILADNIYALTRSLINNNNLNPVTEIQIDCDWTASTKDNYFLLLKKIKSQLHNAAFTISATIRLHQIKYIGKTGVPPVDKGLLMCYNMGNLKNPATINSIIETEELKKYIGTLSSYPLPLDVALPLFGWKVLFRQNEYKGLIQNLPDAIFANSFIKKDGERYEVLKDTLLQGYDLKKGDMLRYEESSYDEIIAAGTELSKQLKNTQPRVSLYHLDSVLLNKYTLHELETIYNSLR